MKLAFDGGEAFDFKTLMQGMLNEEDQSFSLTQFI
jgi:hypothetical protein